MHEHSIHWQTKQLGLGGGQYSELHAHVCVCVCVCESNRSGMFGEKELD